MSASLGLVPEAHRDGVLSALSTAFGARRVEDFEVVRGGASGALTYRVAVAGASYLVRVETRRDITRNPHQYVCLRAAADAGIAPPVAHLDADAGIVIMAYVPQRPLAEHPGGPAALAKALGDLVRRLQDTPGFPKLWDYPVLLERMLGFLRASGRFAPGLLDPHAEAFQRLRESYPWHAEPGVASHNDPNPRNLLFDGRRLWLVDWETSYENDPMVDVAILVDNLASAPEQADLLLEAWLGRAPDDAARARLVVMRALTRLYYAGILLTLSPASPEPHADLVALTPAAFARQVAEGKLAPGSPDTMIALGKMLLAGFLDAARAPELDAALPLAGGA